MRYPAVDDRPARERSDKRYVGSYVRVSGTWRRADRADLENLLVFHLEDSYAAHASQEHPLLKWARAQAG